MGNGCHLCHLIKESRHYNLEPDYSFPLNVDLSFDEVLKSDNPSYHAFPSNMHYSFKALNPQWARRGTGPKWYAYQGTMNPWTDTDKYLREFEQDPTPNKLGTLLATDAETLADELANSWLVLELYGHEHIILPMELRAADDTFAELAQFKLDSQMSTGQPETLQLARAWLQNCLDNHPSCRPAQQEGWLPTRLLDVGLPETPSLRLVSGASLDAKVSYVALSHRWGTNKTFTLKSSNLTAYQRAIPSSDLSDTVRDAAAVTRALGIRYMWVDCICIIQDDDGQDFAHEAETMSKVYGYSTCAIAAANSNAGDGGFLAERNQHGVRPCRVPNPFRADSKYSFNVMSQYLNRIYEEGVRGSEWFRRGWVFQERILAPRLLMFSGKQVLWGCGKLQAAETWPRGKTSENYIDQFASVAVDKALLSELLDKRRGISKSHAAWWTFLQDYMSSKLTVSSDRLPAIRGIAALIAEQTGERFCSGFWLTDDLPHALLWRVRESGAARPAEYRAPSFSWAAVEGEVLFNTPDTYSESVTSLVRILGCVQLPGDLNPSCGNSRNVKEALQISGSLFPASILTSSSGADIEQAMTRDAGLKLAQTILKGIDEPEGRGKEIWYISFVKRLVKPRARGIPVPAILSDLFDAARFFIRVCAYFWITVLYPFCFPGRVRREKAEREADMQCRQRDAEARAERVFADLEKGVRFDEPPALGTEGLPTEEEASYATGEFSLDFILPVRQVIDVFWLPLLRTDARISGLVLRLVGEGMDKRYERLGTFKKFPSNINKSLCSLEMEEFLLV